MEIKIYFCLSYLLAFSRARGPHHPRGEKVAKRHVHYKPTKDSSEKLTADVKLLHDEEHIQEHLQDEINQPDFSKMTDDEVEFYYFQVHDTDKNSKLDGLEILQALFHTGQHAYDENGEIVPTEHNDGDELELYVELIDQVLEEDDMDNDGYLSYSEYVSGRRKNKKTEEPNVPVVEMIP